MKKKKYKVIEIFTPSTPAIETFVERDNKINHHLVDALKTPGKQVVLYGHTKCGKSTLLLNKLFLLQKKSFITRCTDGMTYENIIIDGFDQLGEIYNDTTTKNRAFKIEPSVSVSYADVKAEISLGEYTNETQKTNKNVLPPQLTARRLADFFGASKSCWILEDFHKIKGSDKSKISGLMKVFMDMAAKYPDVKIIALGAVGTAREVVEYNQEMEDRVAEIYIPYMKDEEIEEIINTGEKLLNIRFSSDTKKRILKYSCGLPAICHQLCLNCCFVKNIEQTAKQIIGINEEDLDKAITKFIDEKSDTLKKQFDKSIKVPNMTAVNIPREILNACLTINKDEFPFDEIHKRIKGKRITENDIERTLKDLCSVNRSEILVYDENSNLYRFNNLFLKAYAHLRLREDEEVKPRSGRQDEKIVERLLEIIDKDLKEGYDNDEEPFSEEF